MRLLQPRTFALLISSAPSLGHSRRTFWPSIHAIASLSTTTTAMSSATTFYDFESPDKKGTATPLSSYKNKVLLIVNTASKCGFTPQFQGLEALYKDVRSKHPDDFEILGFPCNQFGNQDPGTDDEIQDFCQVNYGVSFPVMGKVDVNGEKAAPVWEWLKGQQSGIMGLKRVKWNFEKFLVGRDGQVKGRWASTTKPEALREPIEKELNSGTSAPKSEEQKSEL